jgi:hypothetical protein
MDTEHLIEALVRDVAPTRPLAPPLVRTAVWVAVSGLYVAVLIVFMSSSLERIAAISAPRFWIEQTAAFATGVAAAAAALISVVPGRGSRTSLIPVIPFTIWLGTVVTGCMLDWTHRGADGLMVYSDWPCVFAMITAAVPPAIAMGWMLTRGAPLTPAATAALAGLAVAGLGNVAACLSRPVPHGTTSTVLVWHFGTLLVLVSIAAWSGRRLFRWRFLHHAAPEAR